MFVEYRVFQVLQVSGPRLRVIGVSAILHAGLFD